jgi:crossover junction endodeoxyribonuclease RuvC
MTGFVSLGLDLSCTSTGIVVLTENAASPTLLHRETVAVKTKGLQRCSDIAERVIAVAGQFPPQRVVIEGYGGAFKGSLIPLVEVGTVVRYFLRQLGHQWLEPAPTQLKLFVLGKGAGEKEQVMLQVYKRWGHEAVNNDEADAYVLACIGLGHAGKLKGMTRKMLEVLGTLRVI